MNKFSGTGRNDLCPCGSGKKFKKCCGKPGKPLFKAKVVKTTGGLFDHLLKNQRKPPELKEEEKGKFLKEHGADSMEKRDHKEKSE